jgi:hypothetical protein
MSLERATMRSEGKKKMDALQMSISEWLQIIKGEFQEIPGLTLTRAQFQRLWGLDAATCDAVLDALIGVRFLKMTNHGAYTRFDQGD